MRTLPVHTANEFGINAKSEYLIANTPLIYFIKEISLVEEIIVTKGLSFLLQGVLNRYSIAYPSIISTEWQCR